MSDLGAMDRDGRLLYVTDGDRIVHVGVAPVHGTRRAEISGSSDLRVG